MKRLLISIIIIFIHYSALAQLASEKVPVVYGVSSRTVLQSAPYDKWFVANYESYNPDSAAIRLLLQSNSMGLSIDIFFGSWCGDSKREVPRFYKIMDQINFPVSRIRLIGLGAGDSLYKQSPAHEEQGKDIIRVPVFIVYRNGKEINRIIETPIKSLESDLLEIILGESYIPNYRR